MKWGLVLEGGGAKGAYQAGAIMAFKELNIEFGCIAGTSIGAVNGVMLAQGDFERSYDLWRNIEVSKVLDMEEQYVKNLYGLNIDKQTVFYLLKKIGQIIKDKGIDISRMRHIIDEYVDEDKVRKSDIEFGLVTVDLKHMKVLKLYKEDIPKGELCEYVMASGMLPLFKNDENSDKKFFDGGIYDNLPISMVIDKGYKNIIAIRNRPSARPKKIKDESVNIIYIVPTTKAGGILNFTNESVNNAINMGFLDTMRIFNGYCGKLYYITDIDEENAKILTDNLPFCFFEELAKILSVTLCDDIDENIEIITSHLNTENKRSNDFSPRKAFINALIVFTEPILNFVGFNRFKKYTLNQYVEMLENTDMNISYKKTLIKKPFKNQAVSVAELMIQHIK